MGCSSSDHLIPLIIDSQFLHLYNRYFNIYRYANYFNILEENLVLVGGYFLFASVDMQTFCISKMFGTNCD